MLNIADQIAARLHDKGIRHCFGIVGGGNVTLWDAIEKRMPIICTHHEQAAAQAATYYFRTCGRLAPVIVTSGAGSANAITGVMAAHMDGIALLVLSGNENAAHLRATTRIRGVQGYESAELAERFTKWSATAYRAADALAYLEAAMEYALRPRQGAAWLNLPKDIQNALA